MGRPAAQAIVDTTNHTLGIDWAFGQPSGQGVTGLSRF